jgi:hypothetical protein
MQFIHNDNHLNQQSSDLSISMNQAQNPENLEQSLITGFNLPLDMKGLNSNEQFIIKTFKSILLQFKSKLLDNYSCNNDNLLNKYFKIYIDDKIKMNKNSIGFFYILSDNDKLNILIDDNFDIELSTIETDELYKYLQNICIDKLNKYEIKLEQMPQKNQEDDLYEIKYKKGGKGCSGLGYDLDKVTNIDHNIRELLKTAQFTLVPDGNTQTQYNDFFSIINQDNAKHPPNKKNYIQKLTNSLIEKLTPLNILVNNKTKSPYFGFLYEFTATDPKECICENCQHFHLSIHANAESKPLNKYPGAIHLKCDTRSDNLYKPINVLITQNDENFGDNDFTMYRFYLEEYKDTKKKPTCCTSVSYIAIIECLNNMFDSVNIDRYIEQLEYTEQTDTINIYNDKINVFKDFLVKISKYINLDQSINTIIKDELKPANTNYTTQNVTRLLDKLYKLLVVITNKDRNDLFKKKIDNIIHGNFFLDMLECSSFEYIFFQYATKEYQDPSTKANNNDSLIQLIEQINPIINPQSVRAAGSPFSKSIAPTVPDNCNYLEVLNSRIIVKKCDYCLQYLHNKKECCIISLFSGKTYNYDQLKNIAIDDISKLFLKVFYLLIRIANTLLTIMRVQTIVFICFEDNELNKKFNTIPYIYINKLIDNEDKSIQKKIRDIYIKETKIKLNKMDIVSDKIIEYLVDIKYTDDQKKKLVNSILKEISKDTMIQYNTTTNELLITKDNIREILLNYPSTDIIADGGKKLNQRKKYAHIKSKKIFNHLNKLHSKIKSKNDIIKKKQSKIIKLKKNTSKKIYI